MVYEVSVMNEIVNIIASNGMAVAIVAYFLYKDYKFNGQIIEVLGEIKEVLAVVREKVKRNE